MAEVVEAQNEGPPWLCSHTIDDEVIVDAQHEMKYPHNHNNDNLSDRASDKENQSTMSMCPSASDESNARSGTATKPTFRQMRTYPSEPRWLLQMLISIYGSMVKTIAVTVELVKSRDIHWTKLT